MNQEDTSTSEPSVEREVLLNYLISKCGEADQDSRRYGFACQFLGYAALYFDKRLLWTYQDFSSPCYPPEIRFETYRRLFTQALARIQDTTVGDIDYPEMPEHPQATKPGICKKFLVSAMRDGRWMLDSSDFQFLSVFLLISWLGLRFDREALADFENRCVSSDTEPKDKIETGLAILKEALSPRANKHLN
jgi:hypothetical protein